jgi:tetratricopeptide (TPR) repeat protein
MKKYSIPLCFIRGGFAAAILILGSATYAEERPLDGPAYSLATEAYKAFAEGRYGIAESKARQALRLRPDVASLHELLEKSEMARRTMAGDASRKASYKAASEAYRAYEIKDYEGAVQAARLAISLSGQNKDYWLLLIDSLAASGALQEAQRVCAEAIGKFGRQSALIKAQTSLQARLAFSASESSYLALKNGNFKGAVDHARKAVDYLPAAPALHIALINALVASDDLDGAYQAASDMVKSSGPSSEAFLLKGAILQRRGELPQAQADFDNALSIANKQTQYGIRLVAADAALVNGDMQRARQMLEPIGRRDSADLAMRRALLAMMSKSAKSGQSRPKASFGFPVVSCTTEVDFAAKCDIQPGQAPGNAGFLAADEAYRAFNNKEYGIAADKAGQAIEFSPRDPKYRLLYIKVLGVQGLNKEAEDAASLALEEIGKNADLLVARAEIRTRRGDLAAAQSDYAEALASDNKTAVNEIEALIGLGQIEKARERVRGAAAVAKNGSYLDLAYLALKVQDYGTALELFKRADTNGELSDTARYDGAFTAARLGNNKQAINYFSQTVDAANAGRVALDAQQVYDARRAISDLDRVWGLRALLSRRGVAASGLGIPGAAATDAVEAGAEAYWRPYGFQNGKLLEIYGRVNEAVSGGSGVRTGAATAQGALGVRVKPLSETNVVIALERLVPLGSASQGDWLARTGFSSDTGLDLRQDQAHWLTAHLYAEAGHYFQHPQNYATAEAQLGRSFRFGTASSTIAFFPHVVVGGDYDSALEQGQKQAWGSGLGTNIRYWFRQDRYNAPRSYADLSLQYRWRLSGDGRATGWFVRISASY